MKKTNIKTISVVAMLCAAAYLCMFIFKFKVGFLTFDLKDSLLSVIAFLYGPLYGIASVCIVAFLEFITVSDTGVYGLIMNILSSAVFVGVGSMFYKYRRNLLGAIIGSISAVFVMTAVMLVANLLITPFYMGVPSGEVAKMIPTLLLPFNLIKGIVNAALTMIIYKPITTAIKRAKLSVGGSQKTDFKKFIPLAVTAAVIITVAVIIILFVLNGEFLFARIK